ncbi:MAG: hypothetical protein AMXMBFR31_08840 [Candidatus Desulfobacillus denitrificans]
MRIQFASNLADTARWVGDRGKQVNYATAVALTRTAKRLTKMMEDEVRRVFDHPTNFTIRAFGSTPANKVTLTSTVFIKNKQADYLHPNIVGGRRGKKRFEKRLDDDTGVDAYWVPGQGVRLTAAGNLSMSQIRGIAAGLRKTGKYSEVFVGVPRGHANLPFGIWARGKGKTRRASGITPLLVKISDARYKPRFDYFGIAEKHAGRIFNEEFSRAYADALRSVRPISTQMIKH